MPLTSYLTSQAHQNAQTHSDEFVVESLVAHDKCSTLVECLLEFEAWQEAVYPLLQSQASTAQQGLSLYLTLYYGAAIGNFLEVRIDSSHCMHCSWECHTMGVSSSHSS